MTSSFSGRSAGAMVACALAVALPAGQASAERPGAIGAAGAGVHAAAPKVVHRVVWDEYKKHRDGIHLRSANLDGTDVRRLYDAPAGFTTELTMDRAGRRVAFATCCRDRFPHMVIVSVGGGRALKPLAKHRKIFIVGGIGWAPDGTRLAFEGTAKEGKRYRTSLWTVRPNGAGLRRVLALPFTDQPVINDALAWTRDGILYSDGNNLRVAKAGKSHLVLRHADSVRMSGDGRLLVIVRFFATSVSVWTSKPDLTGLKRLMSRGDPGNEASYFGITPNYDGSSLLALRMGASSGGGPSKDEFVMWKRASGAGSASVLAFVGDTYTATWN